MGLSVAAMTKAMRRAREAAIEVKVKLAESRAREIAEARVRASEEFVRGALDFLPHQIAVLDSAGVILAVNEPWKRFARESSATMSAVSIGANYLAAVQAAAASGDAFALAALNGLETLISGEKRTFLMEYPYNAPDGEHWFLIHASRAASAPAAIVMSHTEVSERKRADEALRESEERFASFMRHLPGLAWIKDTRGRYIYANDAAARAFQKPREEIYGKTDQEIFDEETAAQFGSMTKRRL
jgi:PAS domain-containing protein